VSSDDSIDEKFVPQFTSPWDIAGTPARRTVGASVTPGVTVTVRKKQLRMCIGTNGGAVASPTDMIE